VVTIPQLEAERQVAVTPPPPNPNPTPPPPPPPPVEASSGSGMKIAGYVVGGVGVVGLAFGATFGFVAKSKNDQALQNCRTSMYCTAQGLSLTSDAKTAATLSDVFFIGGGVLAATGVVLVIVAPSNKSGSTSSASAWLAPGGGPGGMGMTLGGAW
jgi:hypothetical protein